MSRKKLILIDGSSLIKGAFYRLPSNGVLGIRNLIIRVLETEEADYLAVALNSREEKKEIFKEEEHLKELLATLGIPVFSKEGYDSADILASLTKRCMEDQMEIFLLSEDKRLLQTAGEYVTIRIPEVRETGVEFASYSEESIMEKYGLKPEKLKEVIPLSGKWGIGEKTACSLIRQYQSIENLYDHINEAEPLRVREALSAHRDEVMSGKKTAALQEDCNFRLDYTKSAVKERLFKASAIEDVPSGLGMAEEEKSSLEEFFYTITDFAEAEAVFAKCVEGSRLGLQLLAEDKTVSALALCMGEAKSYCFIPQGFLTPDYLAGKAEEVCKRAGHVTVLDLKSQLAFLKLEPESMVFDAGVAGYLLDPMKASYDYHDLALDYLTLSVPSKTDLIGKSSFKRALEDNREKAASCACYMAYIAFQCRDRLQEGLKKAGMETLFYEIEMPLIYSLHHMEEAGIRVERERLKEYGDRLKVRIAELEEKIYQETGETFNINSPKQLGEVLFDHMKLPGGKKTKTGYSTAADVLEKLAPDCPAVGMILDYRQLTKLNSTYADGLAAYIGSDERIHGTFNQTITATGRISSTEPNLQNIPVRMELGREIRKVFVPQEDCVFIDADYSQIELRVLAHMSGDKRLIGAYRQAEDIHAITASEVFHVPLDEVTPLQRRNAKAVNFGIVYGISSFGLSEGLSITRKEASEYINKYFETYPGVKIFLDRLVAEAREKGYAVSMFSRRRPVPELKSSNFMQRSFGERVAMNSPIQGTAADIIKIAMIRVDRALRARGLRSRIVLQVHDELLIEAYRDELFKVKELLVQEMKHAADLEVSLEVEANVGDSWFDAK